MAQSAFFGSLVVDSASDGLTFGGSSDTLTHQTYYIYDPAEGSSSLLTQIASVATTMLGATVTVTLSDAGYVTIASASSFAWSVDTYLGTILGFDTPSGSGSSSYTADNRCFRVWLPQVLAEETDSLTTRKATLEAMSTQTESLDGTIYTQRWALLERQSVRLSYVDSTDMWGDYGTGERFFRDILSVGGQLCFAPDWASGSTPSTYNYYVPVSEESQTFAPMRSVPGSDQYWDYEIALKGGGL